MCLEVRVLSAMSNDTLFRFLCYQTHISYCKKRAGITCTTNYVYTIRIQVITIVE